MDDGFRGALLSPGTPEFERARRVWNGTINRTPALIARCRTSSDVSTAIGFARGAGLPVSIRCGGHNVAGSAVADGAIMIDLSLMRTVTVDVDARIAEAGGGCLLRDLDIATTKYGLACPAGVFSYTGLGGLALGGGYGWRCRKWGLTCDHIVGAEVVLSDGSMVEVSEDRHQDLLWALRGGGGNFGVVTKFRLRLRDAGPVLVRTGLYAGDDVTAALQCYRAFTPTLSDDCHLLGGLRHARPEDPISPTLADRPVLDFIAVCSADDAASLDESSALFAAMPRCAATERTVSYLDLQTMVDDSAPSGRRYYTKSGYLSELADGAIERLVCAAGRNPSRTGSIDIEYLMGAVGRVTAAESAFPQRDAPFMVSVYGSWDEPALDVDAIAWTRETKRSLAQWEHPGEYLNYVSHQESPQDAPRMYGSAIYSRLAQVKRRYDPDNLFRSARSVTPASARRVQERGHDRLADEAISLTDGVIHHAVWQPTAPALRWGDTSVSYAELAELTMRAHGDFAADPDHGPIAIVGRKSPATIALILACSGAGRTVLLPSPDLGRRALDLLVRRAGCRRMATVTETETEWQVVETDGCAEPDASVRFLLTTSGSTGTPKIVPLQARATQRFIRWSVAEFGLGPGVNVLSHAPLNFDLCLLDIWATLHAGGCVTLVEPEHAVNPRRLVELLDANDVHVIQAVPMFFRIVAQAAAGRSYPAVRHLLLTGDHAPRRVRAALPELFPNAQLHNVYGCTETNHSFMYSFDAEAAAGRDVLPLGRALPGVAFRVMAEGEDLVGPGSGELWVSTPFQTCGYLHEEQSRLVREPSSGAATYFRTGDVVSRDRDGELTLIGRTDFQVKVRGTRVNVEEVERVIREHDDVAEVGVVALPDAQAGKRLHAMVQRSSNRLTGLRLRQHCAERLNRVAIPSSIRIVDTPLPMTSTGKINRCEITEILKAGEA
jgi:acyl-CoA synthetase (AMP-forming)/AMP-acid ligase II/FAD/FMN-containing dehydrogenase